MWRTTFFNPYTLTLIYDFNPRPPCGGRQRKIKILRIAKFISIHVPRVEDDALLLITQLARINFNPRPPCGGRPTAENQRRDRRKFQSTSPVWRTTSSISVTFDRVAHFNPRPPCGGRPLVCFCACLSFSDFNPRPPCGGRRGVTPLFYCAKKFQSTSPVWRTTGTFSSTQSFARDFNPRPPCGGRRTYNRCFSFRS